MRRPGTHERTLEGMHTRTPRNEEEKKKVYFIGGSTTFGNGVEEKNTFVGILKKKNK